MSETHIRLRFCRPQTLRKRNCVDRPVVQAAFTSTLDAEIAKSLQEPVGHAGLVALGKVLIPRSRNSAPSRSM